MSECGSSCRYYLCVLHANFFLFIACIYSTNREVDAQGERKLFEIFGRIFACIFRRLDWTIFSSSFVFALSLSLSISVWLFPSILLCSLVVLFIVIVIIIICFIFSVFSDTFTFLWLNLLLLLLFFVLCLQLLRHCRFSSSPFVEYKLRSFSFCSSL